MKVKEKSEKTGLTLSIQKTKNIGNQSHHFMANTQGEMETVAGFILFGFKIIVDGDYGHEIKKDTCSLEEKL